MYLKKLEIHGFKSFAKKTSFKFEPGITSIVGPNGAGKSNLADSMRWVFGEQSLKLLRGKKTEDVIFAGSASHARLGGAEVAVYFDNTDHRMPIDYQEVVIARRLFRDGTSEYLINGNEVRLLDIAELLARSGFGNTSYHVIGQGMIDQLILGGPAAVKELMEEAAGVKPYYLKRDKTLRRLERTQTNLEQVQALVREIQPRLKSLRRQTKRLEKRADLEKELQEAEQTYYGATLLGLNSQIKTLESKLSSFTQRIEELNQEISRLLKDIEQEETAAKASGQLFKNLQARLESLRETKQELLEEQAILRGQLKVQAEQGRLAPQIAWQEIKTKLQEIYQRFQSLLAAWNQAEAGKLGELLKALLKEFDREAGVAAGFEQKKNRLKMLSQELEGLGEKVNQAQTELMNYTADEEQRKTQLFVKERLLRNKQETLVKTGQAKNQLEVEQAKLTTRRDGLEEEARAALGQAFGQALARVTSWLVPAGMSDKILKLKKQLELIGGVDDLTLQEYKQTEERYQYLTSQSEDLGKASKDLRSAIDELDEVIKKDFQDAFQKISEKFAEYFRILFGGGRATMSVLREQKPQEGAETEEEGSPPIYRPINGQATTQNIKSEITGIDIRATPPGKKLAGIAALSGGERALTSIALLCALLASYPSPFVVLDEVDAALDEANSIRFGKILGTLAAKTQFITITHNRETMRQSHTLYGVTMGEDGISRILSLKLEQAAAYSSKN